MSLGPSPVSLTDPWTLLVRHRISLSAGVRIVVKTGEEIPIWIARHHGRTVSHESPEEAVRLLALQVEHGH